jgi:hypothetical protein
MTTLHIAFRYGDKRLFSRIVCLLRGGDSAHVEVAEPLGDGRWRCTSSSFMDGGARQKDMPLPAEKWRIYRTDIPPERATAWLAANDAEGYPWWVLLRFVLPFMRPGSAWKVCTGCAAEIAAIPRPEVWEVMTLEAAVAWRYERVQ